MRKYLASPTLAIVLLSFIAICSVLGTLIAQGRQEEEYLRIYSTSAYRFISSFRLDDVFHAPYFYMALFLFGVNLLFCTGRMFKRIRDGQRVRRVPSLEELKTMGGFCWKGNFNEVSGVLSRLYRRLQGDETCAVFEKGRLSEYGLLLLHASILIILFGALLGLVFGMRGFVLLRSGEETETVVSRGREKEPLQLPFTIRCKAFTISFYPGGEPKEYRSSLEIIEDGRVVLTRDAVVNRPVVYRGYHIYQASYENAPVFSFSVNGKKVELREKEPYREDGFAFMVLRREKAIHDFGEGVLVAYLRGEEVDTTWLLPSIPAKRFLFAGTYRIEIENVREEMRTGLEVSKDPGIPFVWAGFCLLVVGLCLNLLVYERKIFLRKEGEEVVLAGFARRRKDALSREMERLRETLHVPSP